jgi:hypothetical protein
MMAMVLHPMAACHRPGRWSSLKKNLGGQDLSEVGGGTGHRARDYIQEVAKREKLADEHQYFAYVDSKGGEDVSLSLFDKICKGYDPAPDLDRETKLSIIRSPTLPWKYYLEAHYYFFYRRSFPEEKFGKNRNPGESDLEQYIYLFWASKFVARDLPVLDFLKRLNEIRKYDKEIMDYQEFKSFLIE